MIMSLGILLPIFLGTIAMAFIEIFRRFILNSKAISPLQFLISWYTTATLLFGIMYVTRWSFTMPYMLAGFWNAIFGWLAANFFIQLFNALAASYDEGEVSKTKPIQSMTPGLILGLGLVFGEYPGPMGIAGIMFIMAGTYVLFSKASAPWYAPFFSIRYSIRTIVKGFTSEEISQEEFNSAAVVVLSFLSACMGTVGILFDGMFTRRGVNTQGLVLGAMTGTALLSATYGIWYLIRPDSKKVEHPRGFALFLEKNYFFALVGIASVWVLHVILINPTYHETYVAYTGSLKRLSIPLTVILAYVCFKEKELPKRFKAAILVAIGAILISRDDVTGRISKKLEKWVEQLLPRTV